MKEIDLLAEIRAWRDEFARSHDYDLSAIAAAVREADRTVAERLVSGEPRRPKPDQSPQQIHPVTAGSGA